MCLIVNERATKEFFAKYGRGGYIEVYKLIEIVDDKPLAPYRSDVYPFLHQNFVYAEGHPSIMGTLGEGAIHVFLCKEKADKNKFYPQDYIFKAWAPLHECYGVNANSTEAAFSHIILDDADWERLKRICNGN